MAEMMPVKSDRGILDLMATEVDAYLEEKGWKDDRTFGDECALLVSEVSEALESYREHGMEVWYTYRPVLNGIKMPKMTEEQVQVMTLAIEGREATPEELEAMDKRREGVGPELAGLLVRIFDTCKRHGFDLFSEWRQEMDHNWTRSFRHGNRAL